jgi:hypothetical protein
MTTAQEPQETIPMKTISTALAATVLLAMGASAVRAEPWTDWKPTKQVVHRTYVRVEPGHLDDYLTAIKKTWVPGEETLVKRGVISRWAVQFREDQVGPGANVVLIEWYPSRAKMDPDEALSRDLMAQSRAITPKDQVPALEAERGKYRTVTGEEDWTIVEIPK